MPLAATWRFDISLVVGGRTSGLNFFPGNFKIQNFVIIFKKFPVPKLGCADYSRARSIRVYTVIKIVKMYFFLNCLKIKVRLIVCKIWYLYGIWHILFLVYDVQYMTISMCRLVSENL